jgi:hypothetical protein
LLVQRLLVHLFQLTVYSSQLSIGDNSCGDGRKCRNSTEKRDNDRGPGSCAGRPILGSLFLALATPFLALAFYLIDAPRNQRDDWYLFGAGTSIAILLIGLGAFLAIFGSWLF